MEPIALELIPVAGPRNCCYCKKALIAVQRKSSVCGERRSLEIRYARAVTAWHKAVTELHRLTNAGCSFEVFRAQTSVCDEARVLAEISRLEVQLHCAEHMC